MVLAASRHLAELDSGNSQPLSSDLLGLAGINPREKAPFLAMPGAPSSFLFLVVWPGAPSIASLLLGEFFSWSHFHLTYWHTPSEGPPFVHDRVLHFIRGHLKE